MRTLVFVCSVNLFLNIKTQVYELEINMNVRKPRDEVVKSNLSPRNGSTALRQIILGISLNK